MGSKKSPPAPDYSGAARETAEGSKDVTQWQTFANRPNMETPWGSSSWDVSSQIDPTTGKRVPNWTQTIGLSPEQQKAFDAQQAIQGGRSEIAQGLLGKAGTEMDTPSDFWQTLPEGGQVPGVPGYGQDLPGGPQVQDRLDSAYNPEFAETQFDRQMSLLGPRMEQQREALDIRLRNQGLRPGTQAYDRAMKDQRDQQGEQTSRMSQDAMRLGADEQQREFGRDLAGGGQRFQQEGQAREQAGQEQLAFGQQEFGQELQQSQYQQQLRQNAIAEQLQREGWSLNKINAMLSGQQVGMPSMPSFVPANASQGANMLGAAQSQGQFDQNAAAQQAAQSSALWGSLGTIGGGMMGGPMGAAIGGSLFG